MIFGMLYGVFFVKYKSVLPAMLAHNLFNGVITLVGYLVFYTYRLSWF
jgi:membrane protease YdiL (CAAX protease family)